MQPFDPQLPGQGEPGRPRQSASRLAPKEPAPQPRTSDNRPAAVKSSFIRTVSPSRLAQ